MCQWTPTNRYHDFGILRPFVWFKCSNPTLKDEDSCLAEGECSDPTKKTREACLSNGKCKFAEGFEDWKTSKRDECLNPELIKGYFNQEKEEEN